MEKTIKIGNQDITMKATGNTPRTYREIFGKDLIVEFERFMYHINDKGELTGDFDFGTIERLAYTMAYQHDHEIGTLEEWLDNFGIDDIYTATGSIIKIWQESKRSLSEAKKNNED